MFCSYFRHSMTSVQIWNHKPDMRIDSAFNQNKLRSLCFFFTFNGRNSFFLCAFKEFVFISIYFWLRDGKMMNMNTKKELNKNNLKQLKYTQISNTYNTYAPDHFRIPLSFELFSFRIRILNFIALWEGMTVWLFFFFDLGSLGTLFRIRDHHSIIYKILPRITNIFVFSLFSLHIVASVLIQFQIPDSKTIKAKYVVNIIGIKWAEKNLE